MRSSDQQIAETEDQLRGDFAHLGKLRMSIRRAAETVRRAQQACEDSLTLMARLDRELGWGDRARSTAHARVERPALSWKSEAGLAWVNSGPAHSC